MKYNTSLHNYFNQHKSLGKLFNDMNDVDVAIDPDHNTKMYLRGLGMSEEKINKIINK